MSAEKDVNAMSDSFILVLNCGSSSIKFALFEAGTAEPARRAAWNGKVQGIGGPEPDFGARDVAVAPVPLDAAHPYRAALDLIRRHTLRWLDGRPLAAVAHRVVHGGSRYFQPVRVDARVLADLKSFIPLAPLHQPFALEAIEILLAERPDLPQVACFDTAFHHDKPAIASRFALPRALHDQGVRRYGFHGLSYEYIARRLAEVDPALVAGRVIAAHLGNGASLCAMQSGRSVDTTMGFTALDGLMMGTRCGSLDPGAVLYLQSQMGMSAAEVEKLLYKESGLLGVSGISSDMRTLASSGAPEAEEAMALFAWRAVREAGALATSLGGLDGIVFTAGIGENDAHMRDRICRGLEWLGLEIDERANANRASLISAPGSRIKAYVIPTDEERMIALHTKSIVEGDVR